jgi:hypothetical protein
VTSCLLAYVWASFLLTNSLVQNLPDQAAKPVSNHSDGLLVPEARHIPTIKNLDDAALVFNRGIGSLIEKATHLTVALRGPVTVAHTRALVVAGACANP